MGSATRSQRLGTADAGGALVVAGHVEQTKVLFAFGPTVGVVLKLEGVELDAGAALGRKLEDGAYGSALVFLRGSLAVAVKRAVADARVEPGEA